MIGKILLLAALAVAHARNIDEINNAHDRCPANGFYVLPHEWDCKKFYDCNSGLKSETPRTCDPLFFSYERQLCVPQALANCDLPGVPPPSTEAPPTELLPNGCPADFEIYLLLPHETRCNKFYYCNFGEKVLRQCAPGTYFNPDIQTCDRPENVNCANESFEEELEGSGEPDIEVEELLTNGCPVDYDVHKLLPHESDCSKFYYCVLGETVERKCSEGTLFNPVLQVCDWPENVGDGCASAGGNGDSKETETTIAATKPPRPTTVAPTKPDTDSTTPVPITLPTEAPETEWLPNGCPADYDVHKLLPHETDCGKFYYCVDGEKVKRECRPGTHFNPTIQVCDWPENAGCAVSEGSGEVTEPEPEVTTAATRPPKPTTAAPTKPDNDGTTPAPITLPTEAPETEWLPNGCPADFHVHWLLPHEKDCAKFYYCVYGEKVERICSPGTHFNPAIQVCDWPENAGCAISEGSGEVTEPEPEVTTAATRPPKPTTAAPTKPDTDGTTPAPITLPTEAPETEWLPNGCPADFHVHWLLPHESDCAKFYYCVYGEKVERICSPGTHFNPEIQVCDWPENAGCAISGGSGEVTEPETEVTTAATRPPKPTTAAPTKPDTDGTTPAPITLPTEAPEKEWLPNGCPADFHVHWLLPHESDCAKFYYCVYGEKVERICDSGLHFNPTLQVCDWPANAGCAISGGSGEVTEPETEVTTAATRPPKPTTAAPTKPDNDGTTPAPITLPTEAPETEWLPNGCPADFHVHWLLPHESDCAKFYYCVYGEKVERICDSGLHFNPTLQVCDWPANAGCAISGGSGEVTEPETEVTTAATRPPKPTTAAPTKPDNDGTTPAPITLPTEAPETEWLPNGCPADFHVHWLLPHESDCAKFYYCVYGEKVERICDSGLHFNPTLQVCDWPANAGCAISGGSGEVTEPETEVTTAATRPPKPTTAAPTKPDTDGTTPAPITLPTEAPEKEWLPNGCPADFHVHWLLPHESDCAKFYYCVYGEKVERICDSGLHFNPTLQVCDWPANAGCAISGGSGEVTEPETEVTTAATRPPKPTTAAPTKPDNDGTTPAPITLPTEAPETEWLPNGCPADFHVHWLLPHESDCAKFYYCVYGEKVERICDSGLHFNPTLQVCDWPANAGCAISGGSGEVTEPETEVTTAATRPPKPTTAAPTKPDTDGTTLAPITLPTEAPEKEWLPNGCPADFHVHWLLPHEKDCAKFYYCVYGEKVERICDSGLHFNPTLQVCDWPANAGCAISGGSGEVTEPETEVTTAATRPPKPTTAAPTKPDTDGTTPAPITLPTEAPEKEWLPNGCPADFHVHWLLPHESDCAKFYYCVYGEKVERICDSGLHFNPTLQVCDWPANAGCAISGGSGEVTEPETEVTTAATRPPKPTTAAPTKPDTDGTTPAPITLPTEAPEKEWLPNGCPADFHVHWLLPHESDCAKFYYCVYGEKVERICDSGLHFNPTLQVCDWPANAGCAISGGSGEVTEPETEVTTAATRPPKPTTAAPTKPDTDGTTPAPITLPTEAPETEWLPNGCPADFHVHWLLPHEKDCAKFYYCVYGEKVERICDSGLHFNPTLQVCDWPANAGCAISGGSGEVTEPETEVTTAATRPPKPTTAAPTKPDTDGTTLAPITLPTEAPEKEWLPNGCPADFHVHWLLPHEKDCAKFYYCVYGEKVERICDSGLHFNPTLQVCDWPANAGCAISGGSGEVTEPETEVTTAGTRPPKPTTAAPTEPDTDGTTPAPITLPTEAPEKEWLPNGCPADFHVHWLLPHESDCAKFYYCVYGDKVERICDSGLHFNPTLQVCDWPANAGCAISGGSGEVTEPETEVTTAATRPPKPTTVAPTKPDTDGTTPAPITLPTEAPETEWLPNGCPADFHVHWLLPHEKYCAKFYYCVYGEKVERICDSGLHFNPTLQVCDWPQNAGCANADSGEDISSERGSNENSGENNGGNSDEDLTVNPSDKCRISCNVPAWAHEHDCDKFWRCDGENAVLGVCSEGLHFNVNTQTCDFICNAGCVREDVQSTPEHDGLKLFLPWDKVDKTIRRLYLTGQ